MINSINKDLIGETSQFFLGKTLDMKFASPDKLK
jgi:hypothetical protein